MGANKMIRALGLFFVVSGLIGCTATDTLEVAPEDCAGIPNGSSVLMNAALRWRWLHLRRLCGYINGDALLDECVRRRRFQLR